MKKVAFISDIHSNLPALEATLLDIKNRGISTIYCLGDIIGYHSFTNEVISLLKENGVISIKGNHDEAITEEKFDRNSEKDFVLTKNLDALTDENKKYLMELPITLFIDIDGVSVQIVHGSPKSISEYIREGSEEADFYLNSMTTDVLISGHTHLPYITIKDGKYLLNTGSVGKPKFGKPECSYIVLTIDKEDITPEVISLPYDIDIITEHLEERGFPEKLISALKTGMP